MQLTAEQRADFDRDRLSVLPRTLLRGRGRDADGRGARAVRAPRGVQRAREGQRCGAHELRRPHVQRAVRAPCAPSADGGAGAAAARRRALHAPVQDQRQDGLRGRRLAMAPGLRHLAQRRSHADGARDERRDLPGRRESVQRAADVHPREPPQGGDRREARRDDDQLSAVDARPRPHRGVGGARRRAAATSTRRAATCRAGSCRRPGPQDR